MRVPYRLAVRTIAVTLGCLFLATAATASSELDVTVLPKPGFPAPAQDVDSSVPRLELVSSRYRSPITYSFQLRPRLPAWAPRQVRSEPRQQAIYQQGGNVFLVYGRDGSSARYVVGGRRRADKPRYAFDFVNFTRPPNGGWFEPVTWAREVDDVLYVSNSHLTYASATKGRNAYVSAIDLRTKRTLWRSPALVANARTFVVVDNLIVAGYGFTAEPDFLYLLDRRTGKVLDRLAMPTAPEIIKLRGGRLDVRTYDHDVVARIVG